MILQVVLEWYCWWKKSCTSWYWEYPMFHRVSYTTGGAGFVPSTVWLNIPCAQFLSVPSGPCGRAKAMRSFRHTALLPSTPGQIFATANCKWWNIYNMTRFLVNKNHKNLWSIINAFFRFNKSHLLFCIWDFFLSFLLTTTSPTSCHNERLPMRDPRNCRPWGRRSLMGPLKIAVAQTLNVGHPLVN